MVAVAEQLAERLAAMYESGGDVDLCAFIEDIGGGIAPEDIAELIDADGRSRIERGLPVSMRRYLDAVPDLGAMPVALDAAIEFTLRSVVADSASSSVAVASLIADYPMFESAIRAASLLSEALWATEQLRCDAQSMPGLPIPSDFGPPLPSGQLRYELREVLGAGAQGAVYLAVDRHLSDRSKPAWVAIKVLRHHVGDAVGRERLVEEATRARRIEHPNVVRVLDRGVSEQGDDYIVYEYIDGSTLRVWLQSHNGPLPTQAAASLAARIARGVQAAHSVGVVHCDIKPDNILISRSGEPRVTDFGLAVRVDAESDAATPRPSEGPMGNLGFIAPEQYRLAEGATAPPADVYAVGGVLYYLLTGLLPNGQSVEEVERNLDAHDGRAHAPRPRDARADLDIDLEAICRRALAPRLADRYGSAEALAGDLEAWLRREPIRWTSPSPQRLLLLLCRRQPLAVLLLLLLVATVGVASGLGVAMAREHERQLLQEKVDAAEVLTARVNEYYQRQNAVVASMLESLRQSKSGGLAVDWIAVMIVMEALIGPELTRTSSHWNELYQRRIDRVRELAAQPQRQGTKDLEPLMWETMLGYFLVSEEEFDEAIKVLTTNREEFAARLSPQDAYLRSIDQLLACAKILRTKAEPADFSPSPDELVEIERAAQFLEKTEIAFRGPNEGNSLHRLVLKSLIHVYGPNLLDKPKQASAARNKYRPYLGQ